MMQGGVEAERVARLGALNDSWQTYPLLEILHACTFVLGDDCLTMFQDNWEDQAKRRLGQVHRRLDPAAVLKGSEELPFVTYLLLCFLRTRLQLELMGDNELKAAMLTWQFQPQQMQMTLAFWLTTQNRNRKPSSQQADQLAGSFLK